jgi:hypothetical protein
MLLKKFNESDASSKAELGIAKDQHIRIFKAVFCACWMTENKEGQGNKRQYMIFRVQRFLPAKLGINGDRLNATKLPNCKPALQ